MRAGLRQRLRLRLRLQTRLRLCWRQCSRGLLGLALLAAAPWALGQPAGMAQYAQRYEQNCAACHGALGVSSLADTPSLAGQHSFYAITQLFLFREGRRENPAMTAIAKGMSDDDLRGFSDLIGRLPVATSAQPAPPGAQRLASGGALAKRLHCLGCHGNFGEGGKQVPRIGGQREDYLLLALRGFHAGTRVGYTPAMSEALAGVGVGELQDLAHFLAHMAPPGADASPATDSPAALKR